MAEAEGGFGKWIFLGVLGGKEREGSVLKKESVDRGAWYGAYGPSSWRCNLEKVGHLYVLLLAHDIKVETEA